MSQQLHQQANALLYKVLEQPAASRPDFLREACGGSRALLDLVNSMLSHIDQLDAFLEDQLAMPLVAEVPETAWPQAGETIGNWRALREVQRGALGQFTLVEPADGGRGVAALKIVDAGALGLEELALFHRQRELLARLVHPNIARVIDSGSVADGRPYFVVQYSDGMPLTEFCNLTGLAVRERIALFLPVCHAVHYAHRHLVLHRHLQPGSIVVDRDGLVKVTDFGIAGLLGQPGQQAGEASTASDIEALGRALATLLAGQASATRGDLGAILARATATDEEQRYASADALATDLQRYLARRPLERNAGALADSLAKAMRRRPLAAALALAGLLCVGATSALGWHRLATDAALQQQAYALAGIDPNAAAASRQSAARAAARFVAGSAVSLADRRDQAESVYVRGRMGNLHEAIDAWHVLALAAEQKGQADIQTVALERLARLRHIGGDLDAAHANARELLTALDRILAAVPEHAAWRARQANALQALGAIAIDRGEPVAAIEALRQALAIREELAGEEPSQEASADIAQARIALADGLVAGGDYAGAETEYRLARDTWAAQPDGAALARVWEIDLARAEGQVLRKHFKTAAYTVRALRQSLAAQAGGGNALLEARAAMLHALIQPLGTAAQAWNEARQALPRVLAATEIDQEDALNLRDSALAWRRAGEIGLRAGQQEAACAYLALADERHAQLEESRRAVARDRQARAQLAQLREGCE